MVSVEGFTGSVWRVIQGPQQLLLKILRILKIYCQQDVDVEHGKIVSWILTTWSLPNKNKNLTVNSTVLTLGFNWGYLLVTNPFVQKFSLQKYCSCAHLCCNVAIIRTFTFFLSLPPLCVYYSSPNRLAGYQKNLCWSILFLNNGEFSLVLSKTGNCSWSLYLTEPDK